MKRFALIYSILSLLVFFASAPDAHAREHVFIGGGVIVGQPYYAYPPYYSYPYYAYPPPPPPGYAPAYVGAYAPPPPSVYDQSYAGPGGQHCREYRHTVTIGGQPQQVYGHACREPDGAWHIID